MNRYVVVRTQNTNEHNKLVEFLKNERLYSCYLEKCEIRASILQTEEHILKP